jgi:hypothetical protein
MTMWGRLWNGLRILGHALFYAVMTCVSVGFIVMGIMGWVERDRPVYWGTFTETGGVVRASYQPGGLMGDDENNIVHTATWSTAGLWFPWAAASLTAGAIWYYHRRWRRVGGRGSLTSGPPRHRRLEPE